MSLSALAHSLDYDSDDEPNMRASDLPAVPSQILPDIRDASASLATAAASLSKAAHAMAEAALAMSDASRFFDSLTGYAPNPSEQNNAMGHVPTDSWLERKLEDKLSQVGSGQSLSETSGTEIITYEDEDTDFSSAAIGYQRPPADDLNTTTPCACGPMDISQIRLTPYPPTPTVTNNLSVLSAPDEATAPSGAERVTNGIANDVSAPNGMLDGEAKPAPKTSPAKGTSAGTPRPDQKSLELGTTSGTKPGSPVPTIYTPSTPLGQAVNAHPKLPWGRNYIQLEEEFDAIPIISCMALANKKTICLIPGAGSLGSYGKIVSPSIPA
ncbi:hypothetical protein RhiJN_18431 [Ceratobasidium sp. AG-Ba]|nr:hypothetical protein RhiJN_18431 [Ceratobasidium sp. AG-Ba]